MKTRILIVPMLVATLLVASCSGSSSPPAASGAASSAVAPAAITNASAQKDLVDADLASVCTTEDFVKCKALAGDGTYAVMIMGQAQLNATFQRLCASLAPPGAPPNPALDKMAVVTDRRSFIVVGDTALQFPEGVDPVKISKVLGGEVLAFSKICAPAK